MAPLGLHGRVQIPLKKELNSVFLTAASWLYLHWPGNLRGMHFVSFFTSLYYFAVPQSYYLMSGLRPHTLWPTEVGGRGSH